MSLTSKKAYSALQKHFSETVSLHMRDLFKADTNRFNKFSLKLDDFLLDYSKNRLNLEQFLVHTYIVDPIIELSDAMIGKQFCI